MTTACLAGTLKGDAAITETEHTLSERDRQPAFLCSTKHLYKIEWICLMKRQWRARYIPIQCKNLVVLNRV